MEQEQEQKEKALNSIMREVESYIRRYKVKEFSITWKFEGKETDCIVIDVKNPTE